MKTILIILLFTTTLFSNSLKQSAWAEYKKNFLQESGRIVDPQNENVTHTEAIGYGLYFSYKMGDTQSFSKIYQWYKKNMIKNRYNLPAWKWGFNKGTGKWGILDTTSASDANLWIAYSLSLMYEKNHNREYKKESDLLLKAVKRDQIVYKDNKAYLLPWEKELMNEKKWILNPSYMIFEIFEYMAKKEKSKVWFNLIQNSKNMLYEARFSSLELNPDWLIFNLETNKYSLRDKFKTFSYDAIRIPLNILRSHLSNSEKKALLLPYKKYTEMMKYRPLGIVELNKGFISLYNLNFGHLAIYLQIAKFFSNDTQLFKKALQDRIRKNSENYYAYSLYLFTIL